MTYDDWRTAYPEEWDIEPRVIAWKCEDCGEANETTHEYGYLERHVCAGCGVATRFPVEEEE